MGSKAIILFESSVVKNTSIVFVFEKSPDELKGWEIDCIERILKNGDIVVFVFKNHYSEFFLEEGLEGFTLPEKKFLTN